MGRIQLLPPELVTKIAAGEVIERPASVVKELLENAVDAGARRIDIEVEAGGTELIRVVDDGCGIEAEDLPLAFAAHATSKLRSVADLFAIRTMGFRGEALASIGGVARVVLQSRAAGAEVGAEIRCHGGELSEVRPWNGATGTRVEVRHLFYNVPVRKKFLKSVATELGHICEAVTRLALAQPQLHLTLRHNGKLVYEVPATAGLRERITLFFGAEISDALYELDSDPGPVRLTGYVADPRCDRGHARMQYFFLNGRWFRDRTVAHALQEAYRGLLLTGRYPVAFLYLSLPPEQVDVNVHPTKAEVRFQESSIIYSLVRSVIQRRLQRAQLVPQWQEQTSWDARSLEPPPAETQSHPEGTGDIPAKGGEKLGGPPPPLSPSHRSFRKEMVSPSAIVDVNKPLSAISPRRQSSPAGSVARADERIAPASPPSPANVVLPPEPSPQVQPVTESASDKPATVQHDQRPVEVPVGPALQIQDTYIVLETAQGMLVIDQHALHERILFEQLRQRVLQGALEVQPLLVPEPLELSSEETVLLLGVASELRSLGMDIVEFGQNTVLIQSYPTLLARRPPQEIVRGVVDYLIHRDRPPDRETLLYDLIATMACKAAIKAGDRLTAEEIAALLKLREVAENSHHCPHGRPTALLISRAELDRQFRRT